MKLSQPIYEKLKWLVQIFLPATGGLYFGLSDWWDLPKPLEVVGSISLFTVFLGTIVGISSHNYKAQNEPHAGYLQQTGTDPDTGNPDLGLVITKLPQELLRKDTVTLKIGPPPVPPNE